MDDRVCGVFSPSAVDMGVTGVTAFALTTTVTCAVSRGELTCADVLGSAPRTFAQGVVAVTGGNRIAALLDDGSLVLSPPPAYAGANIDARAVHRALTAWGRTPASITLFDDRLTVYDAHGESLRFLLLRDGFSETVIARDPAFRSVRQATVSASTLFTYECALVGDVERCRPEHGGFDVVGHAKAVKTIGGNCAILEDDTLSCFGRSLDAPTAIGRIPGAVAVSTSDATSGACAIDASGRVVCLGDLGIAFTTRGFSPFGAPRVVDGIDGAVALVVLDGRACALQKDGHLRCFGCVRAHPAMTELARPTFPTEVEGGPPVRI